MTTFASLRVYAVVSLLAATFQVDASTFAFETDAGAIQGYDPVAYHSENKPVKGAPEITYAWHSATWHFASVENRATFVADPERYAPAFGGYCAFGTARGYKVSTEPDAFAIVGGKLYLNYNSDVQEMWDEDRAGYISKAESNWLSIQDEPYVSDNDSVAKAKAQAGN